MNHSNMLRGLALSALLTTSGCFAQGTETGDVGPTEGATRARPTAGEANGGAAASATNATATAPRAGSLEAQPGCTACGPGVPWTPPDESLKPSALPADPADPAAPPERAKGN